MNKVPNIDQEYWIITADGHVAKTKNTPNFNAGAFVFGNCFETDIEAMQARERVKSLLWQIRGEAK